MARRRIEDTRRRLPDSGTLRKLRRTHTLEAIAEMYGVTVSGVYYRLRDEVPDVITPRPRYDELLPWKIAKEHWYGYPAKMLRLYGQREAGRELRPAQEAALDRWVERLKTGKLVVDYDPNEPPNPASPVNGGWKYVPARRGEHLIRKPKPA